jgi:hypothetical protein
MGSYDYIQVPVQGNPISSSLFGARVRASIIDLDRRLSAYDASAGIGKSSANSSLVLNNNIETIALSILGFTFRAGYAYSVSIRCGLGVATNGTRCNFRLRKGSTLTISGTVATNADWGEYFRVTGVDANPVMVNASQYLIRTASTDLTSDFSLTANSNVNAASSATVYANANSPRFMTITPVGFASDFVGMGVDVT